MSKAPFANDVDSGEEIEMLGMAGKKNSEPFPSPGSPNIDDATDFELHTSASDASSEQYSQSSYSRSDSVSSESSSHSSKTKRKKRARKGGKHKKNKVKRKDSKPKRVPAKTPKPKHKKADETKQPFDICDHISDDAPKVSAIDTIRVSFPPTIWTVPSLSGKTVRTVLL